MKIRHSTASGKRDEITLQMTPMIDIVFQLLVFFIMTFKIVAQEGDFNIKMPLAAQAGEPDPTQLPPIKVKLTANSEGALTGIVMNQNRLDSFEELRDQIAQIVGVETGPSSRQDSAEVELDCDFNLRYEYVIKAITAVSGRYDDNGELIKLVEKIKFAPPKAGG